MCVASVSVIATNYATDGIGPARAMWNQAIQKRVSSTSSMLTQIKGLKMMGLTDYIAKSIQDLRASELELSKIFRAFIVKIVLIGMLYHTLHGNARLIQFSKLLGPSDSSSCDNSRCLLDKIRRI